MLRRSSRHLLRPLARRSAALSSPTAARSLSTTSLMRRATAASASRLNPFLARAGALRSMFIQSEPTPNPSSVKFLPGRAVLDDRFSTGVVRVLDEEGGDL